MKPHLGGRNNKHMDFRLSVLKVPGGDRSLLMVAAWTARAFIEAAGAKTILFAWLKTINTAFYHLQPDPLLKPYQPVAIAQEPHTIPFLYHAHIVDQHAPREIQHMLEAYRAWQWP
jgi:hypothetical protein